MTAAPKGIVTNLLASKTSLDLPNLQHARVDSWVRRFTTELRGSFATSLDRMNKYENMISSKLANRGMPQDLIYLAMIESGFSTNPHWTAEIKSLPDHPITRGVKPFAVRDEWYFNIRFRPDMKNVTPILVAKPDERLRTVRSEPRALASSDQHRPAREQLRHVSRRRRRSS